MRKFFLSVLRVVMIGALMTPVMSCEQEGTTNDDPSKNTTDIAVTGLVDKFGCTYADIIGYANLNLLSVGSGNPVIGVEVVEAMAETNDNAVQSTAGSLIGNIFMASFSNLSPATEYKYRSFVTYGGITYYGDKYNTFTTKEVVGVASTGEVSEITRKSAVLSASVQTEGVDARDNVSVGLAWSADKDAIRADGNFKSRQISVQNVEDDVFSATLSGLSVSTTYYYASFTLVGGVYVFSSVKEFTTDDLRLETGAVDLGLSVKWAGCNVGADSPEEYGDYFAWGETTTKSDYSPSTSVTYNVDVSELESRGIIGADGQLAPAYDAATVNWGDDWRMPTLGEIKELIDRCTWEWTYVNGVFGCLVTGPNGNSIFLPAAGYRLGTEVYDRGSLGVYYWSGTLSESYGFHYAYSLSFGSRFHDWGNYCHYYGHTVRPVSE